MKPQIFVGSSGEAKDRHITEYIQAALSDEADVHLWHQSIFALGQHTLDGLLAALDRFDFAVMVFTPDDIAQVKGGVEMVPRDNVVFELGLFMGHLGPLRTFILTNEQDKAKIPSDLLGLTRASYQPSSDDDLQRAIQVGALRIKDAVRRLGVYRTAEEDGARRLQQRLGNALARMRGADPLLQVFRKEIELSVSQWSERANVWEEGALQVEWSGPPLLLLQAYKAASRSIFATSAPAFRPVWGNDDQGLRILQAQRDNTSAGSTRVFLYKERADITADDHRLFSLHAEHNVTVLVYLDVEENRLEFPPEASNDWVIIDDGRAIGVTKRIGGTVESTWFVDDDTRKPQYLALRDRLIEFAIPYRDLLPEVG